MNNESLQKQPKTAWEQATKGKFPKISVQPERLTQNNEFHKTSRAPEATWEQATKKVEPDMVDAK